MQTCRSRKPEQCPCCGRTYDFRVPKRLDDAMGLGLLYRHKTKGYVYLHKMQFQSEWTV